MSSYTDDPLIEVYNEYVTLVYVDIRSCKVMYLGNFIGYISYRSGITNLYILYDTQNNYIKRVRGGKAEAIFELKEEVAWQIQQKKL